MSRSRRAARVVCRSTRIMRDCSCGMGKASRGIIECAPCKSCGRMMHSVYDVEAHQNHPRLNGMERER